MEIPQSGRECPRFVGRRTKSPLRERRESLECRPSDRKRGGSGGGNHRRPSDASVRLMLELHGATGQTMGQLGFRPSHSGMVRRRGIRPSCGGIGIGTKITLLLRAIAILASYNPDIV